jgi:hypothetical protein
MLPAMLYHGQAQENSDLKVTEKALLLRQALLRKKPQKEQWNTD